MTAHAPHPDTHEHGLQDGCPRCAEHAERPWATLDGGNLAALVRRTVDREPARSATEARAIGNVRDVLQAAGALTLAAPASVTGYLGRIYPGAIADAD